MTLRRTLLGNRRFRRERVVGARTVLQVAVWSVVAVAVLTVYRTPSLLDGQLTAGAVLDAIPVVLIPLAVLGVGAVVVLLNVVREVRYLLFGRRRGHHTYDSYDDSEGGGLFEGLGGFGDFDGDGDDGGDGE